MLGDVTSGSPPPRDPIVAVLECARRRWCLLTCTLGAGVLVGTGSILWLQILGCTSPLQVLSPLLALGLNPLLNPVFYVSIGSVFLFLLLIFTICVVRSESSERQSPQPFSTVESVSSEHAKDDSSLLRSRFSLGTRIP